MSCLRHLLFGKRLAAPTAAPAAAANAPTAAQAADVQTYINPTFCVWSCCLVKKIYFTLISLSTQWEPKAHTFSLSFERWAGGPHLFLSVSRRPTPCVHLPWVKSGRPTLSPKWFLQHLHQSEGDFTVWFHAPLTHYPYQEAKQESKICRNTCTVASVAPR